MEIKIDTGKDSKKDIQDMIDFLQRFIATQDAAATSEMPSGAFNLFDDDKPAPPSDDDASEKRPEVTPVYDF